MSDDFHFFSYWLVSRDDYKHCTEIGEYLQHLRRLDRFDEFYSKYLDASQYIFYQLPSINVDYKLYTRVADQRFRRGNVGYELYTEPVDESSQGGSVSPRKKSRGSAPPIYDDFLNISVDTIIRFLHFYRYYSKGEFPLPWSQMNVLNQWILSKESASLVRSRASPRRFMNRGLGVLRRRAENLIALLMKTNPPIPKALPTSDGVFHLTNSLSRATSYPVPIRISGSLQPFLVFYDVETAQPMSIEDLSNFYGTDIYRLLWSDRYEYLDSNTSYYVHCNI